VPAALWTTARDLSPLHQTFTHSRDILLAGQWNLAPPLASAVPGPGSLPAAPWGGKAMSREPLVAPPDNALSAAATERRPSITRWIAPALTVLFVAAAVLAVSLVAAVAGLL